MRNHPDQSGGSGNEHMVVRVRLRGLKPVKARGRWYVYRRATGEAIIKGFVGSRENLMRKLEEPDLMQAYNRPRLMKRRAGDFAPETLGGFVHWYTNGDIDRLEDSKHLKEPGSLPDSYPKWPKLSEATRKDYLAAYDYLREDFDMLLQDVKQPDLYELRDKCVTRKWGRFADKMISALSSMFKQAVRRGKMDYNPCTGMDKAHEADPATNREWLETEWKFARENTPLEVLIPMMIARYAGLRGQTIVTINRNQFEDDPDGPTGKAVRYTPRKNKKKVPYVLLPVLPELQTFLAELKVQRTDGAIAVRDDGSLWPSERRCRRASATGCATRSVPAASAPAPRCTGCVSPMPLGGSATAAPPIAKWLICSATHRRPWAATTPGTSRRN